MRKRKFKSRQICHEKLNACMKFCVGELKKRNCISKQICRKDWHDYIDKLKYNEEDNMYLETNLSQKCKCIHKFFVGEFKKRNCISRQICRKYWHDYIDKLKFNGEENVYLETNLSQKSRAHFMKFCAWWTEKEKLYFETNLSQRLWHFKKMIGVLVLVLWKGVTLFWDKFVTRTLTFQSMYLILAFLLTTSENTSGSCDKFCHEIKFFQNVISRKYSWWMYA